MLADYHLHTHNSEDSNVSMAEYVKRALVLGFKDICFTDHVEYAMISPIAKGEKDYYGEYKQVLAEYGDKLNIKFGAEFGVQKDNIDFFNEFFIKYPFDFVLLSCHTIDGLGLFDGGYLAGKTQKEYNEAYYNEILNVVKNFKNYSVLAHLDLIRRYDSAYYGFEKTKDIVAEILTQTINDGKGIEVNTSCFRYHIPDLTPSVDILKLYKDLGGEIITIGSDAHAVNQFGYEIADVREQLAELGFEHFYTFDKMQPTKHSMRVIQNV